MKNTQRDFIEMKDAPSAISFDPTCNMRFAATSWGQDIVIVEVSNDLKGLTEHFRVEFGTKIMSCCWLTAGLILCGGINCLYEVRLLPGKSPQVMTHQSEFIFDNIIPWRINDELNAILIPMEEDFIIIAQSTNDQLGQRINYKVGESIVSADLSYGYLALLFKEQRYCILDLENLNTNKLPECKYIFKDTPQFNRKNDLVCGLILDFKNCSAVGQHQSGSLTFMYLMDKHLNQGQKTYELVPKYIEYPFTDGAMVKDVCCIEFSKSSDNPTICMVMSHTGELVAYSCPKFEKMKNRLFCGGETSIFKISNDSTFMVVGLGYDWNIGVHGLKIQYRNGVKIMLL
jgi:hypothetical protein